MVIQCKNCGKVEFYYHDFTNNNLCSRCKQLFNNITNIELFNLTVLVIVVLILIF